MVLRGRTSRTGIAIIGCCGASAVWASASATAGLVPDSVLAVLDSFRLSAWLLFAVYLVTGGGVAGPARKRGYLIAAAVYCALAIAIDAGAVIGVGGRQIFAQLLVRIGFGVLGLLTIENLWRNTDPWRRWHVWPLCLALGLLYAYELFLFSDAFITRDRVDPGLALGRAIAAAFAVPLLVLAMARNREWRVDIHVSRQVVLHTATLLASGCFLLAVAVVGMLLRGVGGDWGLVLQLAMLFGSVVVLVTVLSSGSYRQRLKFLISRNFFTNRYDYRVEWLKFIELISDQRQADELQVRIIRALAEFVDSPAGMLWSGSGTEYRPTAGWLARTEHAAAVASDDPFLAGFRDGGWIQEYPNDPSHQGWSFASARAWLAVPLSHRREIVGFVVLDRPHHKGALDWEAFDLLRAAGRQAASYVAEERSTKSLRDAELLTEYSKRFAFVVHDIKNLASQLGLVVSNAHRYIDNPEFQRDMLQTVEDAVSRMNKLLSQLKAEDRSAPRLTDPLAMVATVAGEFSVAMEADSESACCNVAIAPDTLRSALAQLVQNAIDASPAGHPVVLRTRRRGRQFLIDVVDRGVGMDEAFVRNELFRPFRSTKSGGYGIGAYQTRELIRMASGELEVVSRPGTGTTMRITLPLAESGEAAMPSAAA
jgi:putative PEP-CTERM system histidine kinase